MTEPTHAQPRIGFLGSGKMATALAAGLCKSGFTTPGRIFASDVSSTASEAFAVATGGKICSSNSAVVLESDIVVLAVKPQYICPVLADLKNVLTSNHLIVSIAAGVTIQTLLEAVWPARRVVRVMPNTPCLVGESAAGFCVGGNASAADASVVERMFSSVGVAFQLPEHLLDAVTGLSGSGPAYAFLMIEALSDGGVRMGLPRDVATKLAAQTLLGAAKMVLTTGEHCGALKDAVTSPGGTTIAGLHALERSGVRAALMNAVEAATQRSTELSRPH